MFTQLSTMNMNDPTIFQQMGAKKAINKFEQNAVAAVFKEFSQIVDHNIFKCLDPLKLTKEQK